MKLFSKLKKHSFPFSDKPNTATFVCTHVLNAERPILHVTHDEDGYWQFLCGETHTEKDAKVISLFEAYELDNTVGELSDMDYGHSADRKNSSSKWIIK